MPVLITPSAQAEPVVLAASAQARPVVIRVDGLNLVADGTPVQLEATGTPVGLASEDMGG